jgi:hypothetical protein
MTDASPSRGGEASGVTVPSNSKNRSGMLVNGTGTGTGTGGLGEDPGGIREQRRETATTTTTKKKNAWRRVHAWSIVALACLTVLLCVADLRQIRDAVGPTLLRGAATLQGGGGGGGGGGRRSGAEIVFVDEDLVREAHRFVVRSQWCCSGDLSSLVRLDLFSRALLCFGNPFASVRS